MPVNDLKDLLRNASGLNSFKRGTSAGLMYEGSVSVGTRYRMHGLGRGKGHAKIPKFLSENASVCV